MMEENKLYVVIGWITPQCGKQTSHTISNIACGLGSLEKRY